MKNAFVVIIFCMVALLLFATFLSLKEKFLEIQIAQTNKEIHAKYGKLQNLKAEWNYLNNKAYLNMLTEKHAPTLTKNLSYNVDSLHYEQ